MIDFVQDDDRLRDERKKAKKNKDKYVGLSSDAMGFRGSGSRGSGFGSSFDSAGSSSGGGGGGGNGSSGNWRDKFQSPGPSGFRDQHSDEEGNSRGPSPENDVNEFRDEDNHNDNNYSPAPSQPNSFSGTGNKFSDSTTSTTAKATINSSRPTSTSSSSAVRQQQQSKTTSTARPKKTIDLGAAATYAAASSLQNKQNPVGNFASPSKKQTPNNVNLFDTTRYNHLEMIQIVLYIPHSQY